MTHALGVAAAVVCTCRPWGSYMRAAMLHCCTSIMTISSHGSSASCTSLAAWSVHHPLLRMAVVQPDVTVQPDCSLLPCQSASHIGVLSKPAKMLGNVIGWV